MDAKWTTHKFSQLNVYTAKLSKVLSFLIKEKKIYKLNMKIFNFMKESFLQNAFSK